MNALCIGRTMHVRLFAIIITFLATQQFVLLYVKKQIGESRQLKLDQTIYHQLGYGGLVAILSHANQ